MTPSSPVVLRADRADRVRVVLGVALLAAVGTAAVLSLRSDVRWSLAVLYALLIALSVRSLRLSVQARGDELTVRNLWRTTTLHRSEVTGFRIAPRLRWGQKQAWVDRSGGRPVPLRAVDTRNDLDEMRYELEALEAWWGGRD